MHLTDSQVSQLFDLYEGHGRRKDRPDKSILIRMAPKLGGGYLEVVTLDENGEPTSEKRVLFPT